MKGSGVDRSNRVVDAGSRRFALKSALGGAAIAVSGLLSSSSESQARKKKRKKKCPTCPECETCQECPTCQGLANGDACFFTSECCGTETNMACGRKNGMMGFGLVCCGMNAASCSVDEDCCDGFICNKNLGTCFGL
jgi:hypothetical protein